MVGKNRAQVSVEIEYIERVGAPKIELLPRSLNSVLKEFRPVVVEMAEEGPDWVAYSLAANDLSRTFIDTSPFGVRLAANTCCNTARAFVTDGEVSYYNEIRAAYDPEDFRRRYGHYPRLYKSTKGTVVVVGSQDRIGRAGGIYGWSNDKNMIAGALASYRHNFVQSIIAYFKRPRLPLTTAWVLPNLTLEETRAPEQFHPAASFTFRHVRPSMVNRYVVTATCSTPAKLGLEWWASDKSDLGKAELELPEGTTRFVARLIGPPFRKIAGYFTINVIDAPKGITIESVTTTPMTI